MSKKKEQQAAEEEAQLEIRKTKLPRGNEQIGIVEQRLGGSRMYVKCLDGKTRVCRIPGRLKRRLWVREGNFVIVEPWEFGGNEKGDIIFKYKPTQVDFLRTKGYLKSMEDIEEF